jgi:hypothetical protein
VKICIDSYSVGESYETASRVIGGSAKTRKMRFWPGQGGHPGVIWPGQYMVMVGYMYSILDPDLRRASCRNECRRSKTKPKTLMIHRA